jgi:hypothetical protein
MTSKFSRVGRQERRSAPGGERNLNNRRAGAAHRDWLQTTTGLRFAREPAGSRMLRGLPCGPSQHQTPQF